jgi:dephospho-CoA kinase
MTIPSPLRLGLTGGIGSGKSTVARMLQARGAGVIDADQLARECTLPGGSAMSEISKVFGPDFVASDGSMDRQRMRDLVFSRPPARQQLEAIIHPLVGVAVEQLAQTNRSACLVFDVPLLVESVHWRHKLDRVLVVDCPEETQIRRVEVRNGWDRAAIEGIMHTQSSRTRRLAAADWVLFNDGLDLQALEHLVTRMAERFGL